MRSQDNFYGYPMNIRAYVTRGIIWGQRQVFSKFLKSISDHRPMRHDYEGQAANNAIRRLLLSDNPCFIGRFGSGEIEATLRGWDISRHSPKFIKFLKLFTGDFGPFWWDNSIRLGLVRSAGVFPSDEKTLMSFSERMINDSRELTIIASWNSREQQLSKVFFPATKAIPLGVLSSPFFYDLPWSSALQGKKVLVVHPFDLTIRNQYASRDKLFKDKTILPKFELLIYKPVVSFCGVKTPYKDWFEALDKMCSDIAMIDFDIALIGCGAYGFPLGAFVKRELKRKAVHMGGATQLLFGIKGKRWDSNSRVSSFYNDSWVRPDKSERPLNSAQVEGGCYW